jgi:hypothetical protein
MKLRIRNKLLDENVYAEGDFHSDPVVRTGAERSVPLSGTRRRIDEPLELAIIAAIMLSWIR